MVRPRYVVTVLAFVLPIASAVQCSERPGPPNLVLLVLDDLDVAMGSLGAMASARRLAAEGTSFTHYFASTPICCPSRATMLLGQFAHNHGVMTAAPPLGGFPRVFASNLEVDALPVALQEAGYRTALLGKYFIGYPGDAGDDYVPPGWDDWLSPLRLFTYFGYLLNDNGRTVYRGHTPKDYSTDVLAERALEFVRAAERDDRPFFLLLAPLAPHRPTVPAPRHRGTFPNAHLPRVPSFDERDVSDKPAYLRALPRLSRSEIEAYDGIYRGRLQTLPAVDDLVRRLLDTLARLDLAGRTYVFLTSDNGFHLGHHRLRAGKASPYEEDVRLPLLVTGPGVPRGRRLAHLTLGVDLAPTLAQLAGARLARPADGRSLVPLLGAEAPPPAAFRRVGLLELPEVEPEAAPATAAVADADGTPFKRASGPPQGFAGLRTHRLKYVEHRSGERELYDLAVDPYELRNLAATAPPETLARLAGVLRALATCRGPGCRQADRAAIRWPG